MPDPIKRHIAVLRRRIDAVSHATELSGHAGASGTRDRLAQAAIERLPQVLDEVEALRRTLRLRERARNAEIKMLERS